MTTEVGLLGLPWWLWGAVCLAAPVVRQRLVNRFAQLRVLARVGHRAAHGGRGLSA